MRILSIEPVNARKSLVLLDGNKRLPLYKSEIRRYHLTIDMEISQNVYEEIYSEVVLKRAKLRSLNLLKEQDRTRRQIQDKLRRDGYDDATIEQVVEYLSSYGYIDDLRFATNYCQYRQGTMSTVQLRNKLMYKGIGSEIIKLVLEELHKDDGEALLRLIEKKKFRETISDMESYRKAVAFLLRRGFSYELIVSKLGRSNMEVEFLNISD